MSLGCSKQLKTEINQRSRKGLLNIPERSDPSLPLSLLSEKKGVNLVTPFH